MDAVSRFFADRVFGEDRRTILDVDLSTLDDGQSKSGTPNVGGCNGCSLTSSGDRTQ
jgi:hypothetical protein